MLPGAAAAAVVPLRLASVRRPRRLRSGRGWSWRCAPPAPCASHPLPRLRLQLAPPGFQALLPFLPSPSLFLSPSLSSLSPTPCARRAHTHILSSLAFLPLHTLSHILSFPFSWTFFPSLSGSDTFPFVFLSVRRPPLSLAFLPPPTPRTPRTAWPGSQLPGVQ